MSKTEFLAELAKHLQVLEEGEQQDILAEYSQHIDMKIQGGLSEEEAIRDFGPIRELAADILTAYHVRPDFTAKEGGKSRILYVKGPDMAKIKEGSKQAADAVGRQAGRFGTWFRSICRKTRAAFQRFVAKFKCEEKESSVSTPRHGSWSTNFHEIGQSCGSGLSRFFHWLGRVIATLARWFWNACWGGISVLLGLTALAALFSFGLLLVWMVQGYPFVGLTLSAFGMTLAMGALAFLSSTMVLLKKHPTVDRGPEEPHTFSSHGQWEEASDDTWEEAPRDDVWPEEIPPARDNGEADENTDDDHPQEGGAHHA